MTSTTGTMQNGKTTTTTTILQDGKQPKTIVTQGSGPMPMPGFQPMPWMYPGPMGPMTGPAPGPGSMGMMTSTSMTSFSGPEGRRMRKLLSPNQFGSMAQSQAQSMSGFGGSMSQSQSQAMSGGHGGGSMAQAQAQSMSSGGGYGGNYGGYGGWGRGGGRLQLLPVLAQVAGEATVGRGLVLLLVLGAGEAAATAGQASAGSGGYYPSYWGRKKLLSVEPHGLESSNNKRALMGVQSTTTANNANQWGNRRWGGGGLRHRLNQEAGVVEAGLVLRHRHRLKLEAGVVEAGPVLRPKLKHSLRAAAGADLALRHKRKLKHSPLAAAIGAGRSEAHSAHGRLQQSTGYLH
eukprot:gene4165-4413_t